MTKHFYTRLSAFALILLIACGAAKQSTKSKQAATTLLVAEVRVLLKQAVTVK